MAFDPVALDQIAADVTPDDDAGVVAVDLDRPARSGFLAPLQQRQHGGRRRNHTCCGADNG